MQSLEVHKNLCILVDSTAFSALTHKVWALMKTKDKT